jgi:serine/threonine-protein kinase HipA
MSCCETSELSMVSRLLVLLEGRTIGRLDRKTDGRVTLTFNDDYTADTTATPLSVGLPSSRLAHSGTGLDAWLAGLLPDNDRVIDRWSKRFQVGTSPFSLLSSPIGVDCAGAVQFVEPDQVDVVLNHPSDIEWLTEDELSRRVDELVTDSAAWLGRSPLGQFSLAGAQSKTALFRDGNRWGVPSGDWPTTHILKPAILGFEHQEVNEHLCLATARRLGLLAARTEVLRIGQHSVFVAERYDRHLVSDSHIRIHQEDMCQALGVRPQWKYESEGGPTAQQIASVLRGSIEAAQADAAVRRFVDALAFNWLIAGTDAHAKNYSLLLSGTQVRLAPMYDVASILPYDDSHGRDLRTAMKLGGEYRLNWQYQRHWQRLAVHVGLPAEEVLARVNELAAALPDAFGAVVEASATLDPMQRSFGERLIELVSVRAATCRRQLAS